MSETVSSGLLTGAIYGEVDGLRSRDELFEAAEAAQKRYEAKHGVWETVSPPDKKSVGWWKHVRLSGVNDKSFALTLQEYFQNDEQEEALQQILRAYEARLLDELNYLRAVSVSDKAGEFYAHLRQLIKLRQLYVLVKTIPNQFVTSATIDAVKDKPEHDARFKITYKNGSGGVINHGTTVFLDLIAQNGSSAYSSEANLIISSGTHGFNKRGIVRTSRMTRKNFGNRIKKIILPPSAKVPQSRIFYNKSAFVNDAVTASNPWSAATGVSSSAAAGEMVTPPKPKRGQLNPSSAAATSSSMSAAASSKPVIASSSMSAAASSKPVIASSYMSSAASYRPAASSSMSAAASSKPTATSLNSSLSLSRLKAKQVEINKALAEYGGFNWDTPPPPAAGGGGGPGPSFRKKYRHNSNKKRRSTRRRK